MSQAEQDAKDLESLFNLVGFVVVQWGQAEQSLDLIVAMLYQDLGGDKFCKRLPKMLAPKLEFVEKCMTEISNLNAFKSSSQKLVEQFNSLSPIRHDLVHGAIADTVPENGAFKFVKLDFEKEIHVLRDFKVEGEHIPELYTKLIDLGANSASLANQLWASYEHTP